MNWWMAVPSATVTPFALRERLRGFPVSRGWLRRGVRSSVGRLEGGEEEAWRRAGELLGGAKRPKEEPRQVAGRRTLVVAPQASLPPRKQHKRRRFIPAAVIRGGLPRFAAFFRTPGRGRSGQRPLWCNTEHRSIRSCASSPTPGQNRTVGPQTRSRAVFADASQPTSQRFSTLLLCLHRFDR